MNFPKPKKINAEKYIAGQSLFKRKIAKIKLSANESALGPSPKAIRQYIKVGRNLKKYPDSDYSLDLKFKKDLKNLRKFVEQNSLQFLLKVYLKFVQWVFAFQLE